MAGVKLQAPVEPAVTVPRLVVPSYRVTTLLASAVPERVGLELLVAAPAVVITGALGAVVSILAVTAVEAMETLPAASVTVAVMLKVSEPVKVPALAV